MLIVITKCYEDNSC